MDISPDEDREFPVFRPVPRSRLNVWGKGLTETHSKASALMEFVERYSASYADTHKKNIRYGTASGLPGRSIPLSAFTPYNFQRRKFPSISELDAQHMGWIDARSLMTGECVAVPVSRVLISYTERLTGDYCCSNGLSANNTFEEAMLQGLAELIERHTLHVHYLHKDSTQTYEVDVGTISNQLLSTKIESLIARGWQLFVSWHETGLPFHTLSVLLFNPASEETFRNPGCYVHFATALDPETALSRCITECFQAIAAEKFRKRAGLALQSSIDQLIEDERAWRTGTGRRIALGEIPSSNNADYLQDVEDAISRMSGLGFEVLVANCTHPDLEIPVVRVLCPELQPNFLLLSHAPHAPRARVSDWISDHAAIWKEYEFGSTGV